MLRKLFVLVSVAAVPALAQVVSYEADSFPERERWLHLEQVLQGDRWLEDGWLFQEVDILPDPPFEGERDSYRRNIPDLAGTATDNFFLEWVVETNGPEAFGAVAPCSMVAAGQSGVLYHFTIARDEVRLLRDFQIPLLFFDIEPNMPHTYRLELQPGTYTVYIDGDIVDAGVSEGPYPSDNSFVVFSATGAIETSVTKWDFVRLGVLPDSDGDYDSDDDHDLFDYYFFQECFAVGGPETSDGPSCDFADIDQDGDVDLKDFAALQNAFTGEGE